MAATLPRNTFQKLGLSVGGLKTAFSSLTSTLTTMRTECAATKTERDVREISIEHGRAALAEGLLHDDEWDFYKRTVPFGQSGAFLQKQVWDSRLKRMVDRPLFENSVGLAIIPNSFAKGAERLVFHATEVSLQRRCR